MDAKIRLLNSEDENYIELKEFKNLKNNNLLSNISSNSNLKLIFTYLKYDDILKLIKNNKSLQNKIGIEKTNYMDYSNIKIVSNKIIKRFKPVDIYTILFLFLPPSILKVIRILCCCNIFYQFFIILIALFVHIFFFIYPIYIITDQEKLNIISVNLINASLFGITIFIIFLIAISNFLKIHMYVWVFFTLIHILYEILILIKSYYLIAKEVNFMDKLFIWINFFYISCHLNNIIKQWPKITYQYFLKEYKNIKIDPYLMEIESYKKNKKKYITNIVGELKYIYSEEDLKILYEINRFRNKNNLPYLESENNFPDFITNEISEIFIFEWKNLFILPNIKYLFKYDIGEFNNYFQNNDRELIQILLKNELNRINIVTQKNIQYILLYHSDIDIN